MNSESWGDRDLGAIAKIKGGKRLPKGVSLQESKNAHPYIRVSDMGNRYIDSSKLLYVPDEVFPLIFRYIVQEGDIILSIVGTIGVVSKITPDLDHASLTENCVKITNLDGVISDYLYYYLTSENCQNEIKSKTVGTTQPKLPIYNIMSLHIPVPPLSTQQRIADILNSLDDKIELNRQTNATLEAIAQAIFKEWFVDFNYPGATGEMVDSELGPIPKGWQVVQIGKLFGSALGGDWGSDAEQDKGDILCGVIRGTDFENLSNGFVDEVPQRYIKHKSLIKRQLREGDIIIEISGGSKDQATGRNLWVSKEILDLFDQPIVPTSFCRLIRPDNIDISLFLATFLSGFYKAGGTWDYQLQSTGISNFQFNDFSSRQKIVLPDAHSLRIFSRIVYSLFSLRGRNSRNNQSLASTLNLLLPKLLSGSLSSFEISENQLLKD